MVPCVHLAVSFRAGDETFILLTAHIDYGQSGDDRIPELKAIAKWLADWLANWARGTSRNHQNCLVLGDFNIDRHGDGLWKAFTPTHLFVPQDLHDVKRFIFIEEGEDPS